MSNVHGFGLGFGVLPVKRVFADNPSRETLLKQVEALISLNSTVLNLRLQDRGELFGLTEKAKSDKLSFITNRLLSLSKLEKLQIDLITKRSYFKLVCQTSVSFTLTELEIYNKIPVDEFMLFCRGLKTRNFCLKKLSIMASTVVVNGISLRHRRNFAALVDLISGLDSHPTLEHFYLRGTLTISCMYPFLRALALSSNCKLIFLPRSNLCQAKYLVAMVEKRGNMHVREAVVPRGNNHVGILLSEEMAPEYILYIKSLVPWIGS